MAAYLNILNVPASERGHLPELRTYSKDIVNIPEHVFNAKVLVIAQHIMEAQAARVIAHMTDDNTQWFIEFRLWTMFS